MLVSGPMALVSIGSFDIALLVFLTSILFPLLTMLGALYLLIPAHFGFLARGAGPVFRLLRRIMPWSMLGVFMLGAIIAAVKLLDLAQLELGISLIAFIALLPVIVIAQLNFDSSLFWPQQTIVEEKNGTGLQGGAARQHGLLHCHTCAALVKQPEHDSRVFCPRCGDSLHIRKPNSEARTWALLITGMMLFIPANTFPIMTVVIFGQGEPNTILAGVIHLFVCRYVAARFDCILRQYHGSSHQVCGNPVSAAFRAAQLVMASGGENIAVSGDRGYRILVDGRYFRDRASDIAGEFWRFGKYPARYCGKFFCGNGCGDHVCRAEL